MHLFSAYTINSYGPVPLMDASKIRPLSKALTSRQIAIWTKTNILTGRQSERYTMIHWMIELNGQLRTSTTIHRSRGVNPGGWES